MIARLVDLAIMTFAEKRAGLKVVHENLQRRYPPPER